MSRSVAIVLVLVVGAVVGLQPPANAALSQHVGDLGAALVSTVISVTIIAVALVVFGEPSRLSGVTEFRPAWAIGGVAGAAVVAVGLVAVRPLGAGPVVALLVAAQIVIAVISDRFGWFGVHHVGIGAGRLAGVALVIAGTVLVTRT